MEAEATVANEIQAGAEAVRLLMMDIGRVSDATCIDGCDDTQRDSRDYAAMTRMVLASMGQASARGEWHQEGFARALAHLLCLNADGCGVGPEDWQPIRDTGGSRSITG